MNNLFLNIVKELEIPKFHSDDSGTENIKDPVSKAILKYKNHPSILAIQKYRKNKIFYFEEVKIGEIKKEIPQLDKSKTSQKTDISTRSIKENIDIFAEFLCTSINGVIKSASSPCYLKLADVTPLSKKMRKDMKENFRPVTILLTLSKIFEKCMFAQISTFFDNIFSNQQCGFRKGCSAQRCLLVMLETWKWSIYKGKVFGTLLTGLSKALGCLDHELLTAKVNTFGFSLPGLRLINDYLSNRKQRTKIENT